MGAEQSNREPATKQDIERVVELVLRLHQDLDARFAEVDRRFDAIDRRFEAMEVRMDRLGETMAGMQQQMAGMTRWSNRLDRDNNAMIATQEGQRRAIDDLAARVSKLESRS